MNSGFVRLIKLQSRCGRHETYFGNLNLNFDAVGSGYLLTHMNRRTKLIQSTKVTGRRSTEKSEMACFRSLRMMSSTCKKPLVELRRYEYFQKNNS